MTGRTVTRAGLARSLEQSIVVGDLVVGQKLPSERTLVSEHGVGRSSVREAIRELSDRGLVEIIPGRGTFVTRPGVADIATGIQRWAQRQGVSPHEILDARGLIEVEAAGLAAVMGLGANAALVELVLDRLEQELDPIQSAHLDIGFHLCFARASGNPMLELLLASLAPITTQLVMLSHKFTLSTRDSEHRAVFAAVAGQIPAEARDAVEAHLRTGHALFADSYDQPILALGTMASDGDLDDLLEQHQLPAWTWE